MAFLLRPDTKLSEPVQDFQSLAFLEPSFHPLGITPKGGKKMTFFPWLQSDRYLELWAKEVAL